MADVEKVIYDIERCICHVPGACRDCSRYDHVEVIGCMEGLLTDALALLKSKRPLPVKCDERKTLYSDDPVLYMNEKFYICPCCGKNLSRTRKRESILYCDNCGQALDWEEGDRE